MTSVSDTRHSLKHIRNTLSPDVVRTHSQIICQNLTTQPAIQAAQHIAVYLQHGNEVDLSTFCQQTWQDTNKRLYLPIVDQPEPGFLAFGHYTADTVLTPNQFGILEPTTDLHPPRQLDVVMVPMVGFDAKGHRIGMGGGYYDRTFAFRKTATTPLLIGCAFSCQRVAQIDSEAWDVDMDFVVTEKAQNDACEPL